MERMIAMQAPICTTRLLPTRVSCRHPMFSLSECTQHSSVFEPVWLPFRHIMVCGQSPTLQEQDYISTTHTCQVRECKHPLQHYQGPGGRMTHMLLLHCQSL